MTALSRQETRWNDRTALVVVVVALAVAAASAAATLVTGSDDSAAAVINIVTPSAAALLVNAVAVHLLLVRRQRSRERVADLRLSSTRGDLDDERRERALLRELDRAVDAAPTERAAIAVIREAFIRNPSMQPIELHLVDPVDPVLTLALAAGEHVTKPGERTSPWDSLAARTNQSLVYSTTDRLDVCRHISSRVHAPMSVIAVPLNAMDRLLGVIYSFGPAGRQPTPGEISLLEDIAATIGARLALLRTVGAIPPTGDEIDRLTGLPDRAATQDRVLRMLRDRTDFTVAVADIDALGLINETEGRDVGDRALQLLSRVARKAVRPGDVIGRIGGDELLFILPRTQPHDATRALERLREELVLAQSETNDPSFTLSIGVIGSTAGGTIEEILHRAAGALEHAKLEGGNRVVVAEPMREAPPAL